MKKAPEIMVQLVHIEGPMKGEIHEFSESSITIGRHPSCREQFPKDITVVSRRHAEIKREGNRFKLIDTSTNGTFLNGHLVKGETYLKDGDVLMFAEGGPKVSFLTRMMELSEEILQPEHKVSDKPVSPPFASVEEAPDAPQVAQKVDKEVFMPEKDPVCRQEAIPVAENDSLPVSDDPQPVPGQKVKAPFVIQCGPTIRSYRELPVVLGKSPDSDFLLDLPGILDRHAEFFFSEGEYWVRDLTGKDLVSLNNNPVKMQAQLILDSILRLTPSGPAFRFLGAGRLAEVEDVLPPSDHDNSLPEGEGPSAPDSTDRVTKGVKSIFRKLISH